MEGTARPMTPPSPLTLACILAAGAGVRLGTAGQERPKGFLRLGDRPIVVESIERLRRAGVERIVIVTGHRSECYDALREPGITLVHNPSYARSGSLWSLCCARDVLREDFLLLESDVVYEQRALDTLQESAHANAILVSGFTGSGDEVYVASRGGRLVGMSKRRHDLTPGEIQGEMVGLCRISTEFYGRVLARAESLFPRDLHGSYETAGLAACAHQVPVSCPLVPDLLWAEIDDLSHLRRAQERVYPAIMARENPGA